LKPCDRKNVSIRSRFISPKVTSNIMTEIGLPTAEKAKLDTRPLEQLENLSIAALHFSSLDDLRDYLA
jgi:Domain of unknown function (DUF4351)